jgi:hypothetical protein
VVPSRPIYKPDVFPLGLAAREVLAPEIARVVIQCAQPLLQAIIDMESPRG